MKTKLSLRTALLLGVPLVASSFGLGALAQGTWTLSVGGRTVSTSARKIGGTTYVPIGDVAKALNMRVSLKGNRIALLPAGGAQQVGKVEGNIGEDLSSGLYGFKVTGVTRAASYDLKYPNTYQRAETVRAPDGQELVIVSARVKNQTPNALVFSFPTSYKPRNTALTDMDAQSYAPIRYDANFSESAPFGCNVLPAASQNFVMVFAVPRDTKIKDVVYSAMPYRDWMNDKSTDFRVHLKNP